MKRVLILELVVALTIPVLGQLPGQSILPRSSTEISLRLSVTKASFVVGDSVAVVITLQNGGGAPLVVSNRMNTSSNNREGRVSFEVTDSAGRRESAQKQWIADNLSAYPKEPDWRLLLGNWLILYPHDSFSTELSLDQDTFTSLGKPGVYTVTATYSSAGFSYPENYRRLGLTDQDAASEKTKAWAGSVRSNSIGVTLVAARHRRKPQ